MATINRKFLCSNRISLSFSGVSTHHKPSCTYPQNDTYNFFFFTFNLCSLMDFSQFISMMIFFDFFLAILWRSLVSHANRNRFCCWLINAKESWIGILFYFIFFCFILLRNKNRVLVLSMCVYLLSLPKTVVSFFSSLLFTKFHKRNVFFSIWKRWEEE